MHTALSALAALVALIAVVANGFTLRPQRVTVVGRAPIGGYLWRPTDAVAFSNESAAVKLQTSPHGCEYQRNCEFTIAVTGDAGQSWKLVSEQYPHFCGTGGSVKDGWLHCPGTEIEEDGDDKVLTHKIYRYTVETPSGKFIEEEHKERMTFDHTPFGAAPAKIKAGNQILNLEDRKEMLLNARVTLSNGSSYHVLYKSEGDGAGRDWRFQSYIPVPFGAYNALQRIGETRIMAVGGTAFDMNQTSSLYLGTRWDPPTKSSFVLPVAWHMSRYMVSVSAGLSGWPGISASAMGSKRSSDRTINIADFHNRVAAKTNAYLAGVRNYTADYLDNKEAFECLDEKDWSLTTKAPIKEANWHKAGCSSSSHVALVPLGGDKLFAFYDQLGNGFNEAETEGVPPESENDDHGKGHTVYAMEMLLNETKEKQEYEDKIKADKERREQEAIREAARRKAEEEMREQRAERQRQKLRANQARREEFAKLDAQYVAAAQKFQSQDGELIVVRDVDPEWADVEKEYV